MAFDYEAAKAEFGVGRAREMERAAQSTVTAATDAPQATSQPQGESGTQKAGVGGAGWNEDFDEAWGRRVLENSKLKDVFGLSDYSSLRDSETRRQINRWLRENKGGEGTAAASGASPAATAAPAASTQTTGAGKTASTGGSTSGANTTGKAKVVDSTPGLKPPVRPQLSRGVIPSGRIPPSELYGATTLAGSGGTIPAMPGPWWPSYPTGAGPAPATSPGVASLQAAALEGQRG